MFYVAGQKLNMEKIFMLNVDVFKAFAYHSRGNISTNGTLRQSMAYLIGHKFDNTYVSTELVFPRQQSCSNNCKELGKWFFEFMIYIMSNIIWYNYK